MNRKPHAVREGRTGDTMQSFMSLMVVLIPLLLVSAEFARISIIELSTTPRGVQPETPVTRRDVEGDSARLDLTVIVTDSAFTIGAAGGFLPSIRFAEYHEFLTDDGGDRFRVPYVRGMTAKHPRTGSPVDAGERTDIALLVTDSAGGNRRCLHTPYGEALTDRTGEYVEAALSGDTLFVNGDIERPFVVTGLQHPSTAPLSAFDALSNLLLRIRTRYASAPDRNQVIIAAESAVLYDKLIGVMDAVRMARFEDISIGRLREI